MKTEKEPNPLNFFGERQLDLLPPNFDVITMSLHRNKFGTLEAVTQWVYDNCKGRFYVGKGIQLSNGTIESVIKLGFEDPKESSYFVLACPYLND